MKRHITMISIITVAVLGSIILTGCELVTRNQRLTIEVTTPSTRGNVTEPEVLVSGVVSDADATLRINDTDVEVASDGAFSLTLPLAYGSNRISLRAEKEGQNPANRSLTMNRTLTLTILAPEATIETGDSQITITGTISDPSARITVTGRESTVAPDGSFTSEIPLYYLETVINVTASVEGTSPVTETITVIRPEA
jgi:hypothetical protein